MLHARSISKIFRAEFSSSNDFNILKIMDIKQVLVTRDDINASSGICTVDEFVVIRISAHFKSFIWDDHAACFCNLSNGNIYTFLRIFVLKFFEGFVILLQYFRSNKRFQLFFKKVVICTALVNNRLFTGFFRHHIAKFHHSCRI